MRRKGFTLIELLTVIVILGIILLIIFPVVTKIIEEAEKGAFRNSAYGIVKAGEMLCSQEMLKQSNQPLSFTYNNGKEISSVEGKKLDYKGTRPKSGDVLINNKCNVEIAIHNGKWCAKKAYNENVVTITNDSSETCKLGNAIVINPVYTEEKIDELVNRGWIPVANTDELAQILGTGLDATGKNRIFEEKTWGKGTKWEMKATGTLESSYIQVANIDLSSYGASYDGGRGWLPIGYLLDSDNDGISEEFWFTGKYNGGNYTISNLYINRPSTNWMTNDQLALFGATDGAEISNIKMKNVSITGNGNDMGALIGEAYENTFISNIRVENVNINAEDSSRVGGIIGSIYAGSASQMVKNLWVQGKITLNGGFAETIGGAIGTVQANIYNVYADVDIIDNTDTKDQTNYIGGFSGNLKNNYNINKIETHGDIEGYGAIGGVVGEIYDSTSSIIERVYSTGKIKGEEYVGGLVGGI